MAMPIEGKLVVELRDYLAEERTVLAWIRTGLALMGLGFVVARFGLFLEEIRINQGISASQSHGPSIGFGTALISVGVVVSLFSAWRSLRPLAEWNRGQTADRRPSKQAAVLALFLALGGIAMAIYLTVGFYS